MKVLIKTTLFHYMGDENNAGKVDLDELLAKIDAVVASGSASEEAEDLSEFLHEAARFTDLGDTGDGTDLTEIANKLRRGEMVGCVTEETISVLVPLVKNDGETAEDAYWRINAVAAAKLAELEGPKEFTGDEFDEDDWDD